MNRGPGAIGSVEKAKDFKGTLKKLFKSMSKYLYLLLLVLYFQ